MSQAAMFGVVWGGWDAPVRRRKAGWRRLGPAERGRKVLGRAELGHKAERAGNF
jgi:hypothetical protein